MPNKTKLPALKNIPPKTDRELKIALDSIKEALEVRLGQRGDPLDRAVTLRELSDSGIVKVRNKGGLASDILPPGDDDPGGNLDIPPPPTGLSASGVFTAVILDWNEPPYNNHAYTEIWRSQDNALGGAVRVATTVGNVYTDEVGYATTHYYWIRFVSTSNVIGPYNGTEGKEATTAANVSAVMTTLSEEISNMPGFTTLQNDITVNVDGVSSSLASALSTLDTATETAQTAANNAQTAANNAQATANSAATAASNAQTSANNAVTGATQVIQSTSAPTTRDDGSALQAHDIWIDTDDNNQAYVRNSSNNGWEKARDSSLVSTIGSASFTGSDLTTAMASAQSSIITINSTNTSQASAITNLENTVNDGTTGVAATATALSNLTTRVTNTENATSTNTSDITALETTVNHPSTGVAATSTALNNLTTGTVATNTGNISTNASDIAALQSTVNHPTTGVAATSTALNALETGTVATNTGDIATNASDISALQSTVNNPSTGVAATASALGALTTRVTNTENETSTNASDISALESTVNNPSTGVAATSTALNNLTTGTVATNTGNIATNASDISALQSTVNHPTTGVAASASAIGALDTRVTANEGDISTNASDISALEATVNNPSTGVAATSTALNNLTTGTVATNTGNIATNASDIAALQSTVNNPSTGVAATATALNNLTTGTVATNTGDIATNASDIAALQSTVNNPTTGVAATATALNNLTTGTVATNTGDISTNAGNITALQAIVSGFSGSGAIANAFSTTNANVSTNAGNITSNANSITALESQVGKEFGVRLKTTNTSKTVTIQTMTNSAGSTTTSAHGITSADVTSGAYITLVDASAVGGITTTQLNKTHKIQSVVSTTSLTITVTGDAATSTTTFGNYTATENNILGAYAGIAQLANVQSDLEGNAQASFVLQVAANGSVAGMVIEADASAGGTASQVAFQADKFAIFDGSSAIAPFIVTGGSVFIADAMIGSAAIDTAQIANLAVEEAKIDNLAVTTAKINNAAITTAKIEDAAIETAKIGDAQITNAKINDLDAGKINAGFIAAARIDSRTITADKINTANLSLPIVHKTVSGAAIGTFNNDTMRVKRVGEIGTEPGLYSGFVRVKGGSGQVKTLEVAAGDGTFGTGASFDIRDDIEYDSGSLDGSTTQLPLADTGSMQYVSGASKYWSRVDRFRFTHSIAQISFHFRKRSSNSTTAYLYVNAQGDGNNRLLGSVEYAFTRLGVNEPDAFSFTDLTGQATSTVFTSNTITLSGNQFVTGVVTLTDNAGGTAEFKVNNGTYQTGSATVEPNDTITVRLTSASTGGTTRSANIDVNGINDLFIVQTSGGGAPPPPPPGGSPGGSPPSSPPSGPPSGGPIAP